MRRILTVLIVTCTLLSLCLSLWASHAYAAGIVAGVTSGYAHGGYAKSPSSTSNGSTSNFFGPIAPIWQGCNATPSASANNSTSSASLGSYMTATSTNDVVTTSRSASSVTSRANSTVEGVNILNGLITASKIVTVANSVGTATDAASNENGSAIAGLVVDGIPISALPAPNTTVSLPGLGYVVLNEESIYNSPNATSANINMLHVYITQSNSSAGVSNGTDIVVGHASSNFFRTAQPAIVNAYSSGLNILGKNNAGSAGITPVAPAEAGCTGGNAQTTVNGSSSPNIGNTGQVDDTASGQISRSAATATAQSIVHNINLLKGLVQGSQIRSVANAAWNGRGSGSALANLVNMRIAGIRLASSPAPNTRMRIPGLGYAILNEQFRNVGPSGAQEGVNAIDIVVTQSNNSFGLAAGMHIILGFAYASVASY